jgi:hypothetical protein
MYRTVVPWSGVVDAYSYVRYVYTSSIVNTEMYILQILTSVRLESTVRLSMPTAITRMEVSPASVPAVTTIRESLTNV